MKWVVTAFTRKVLVFCSFSLTQGMARSGWAIRFNKIPAKTQDGTSPPKITSFPLSHVLSVELEWARALAVKKELLEFTFSFL
jgi:hypothetical protein